MPRSGRRQFAGDLGRHTRLLTAVLGLAAAALVVLRLHSGSALWLDEALSVNIAKLPLHELPEALRQDGSPPLYYLLLHYWIDVFGSGDIAVRALSTLFSLASLPLAYLAGRRIAGPAAGRAALLALAASPFAVRYATETRMYALLILLALLGLLALLRAEEQPTLPRLAAVSVISGLLALTHYWAFFLLAVAGALLAYRWRRGTESAVAGKQLAALVGGAALFIPWVPSFLYQLRHTGTPWAATPDFGQVLGTVQEWAGAGWAGQLLYLVFVAAVVAAVLRSPVPTRRIARILLLVVLAGLTLGILVSRVQSSGYAMRYSAPFLAAMVVLLGVGLATLSGRQRLLALTTVVVLGLIACLDGPLLAARTQARSTAAVIRRDVEPGDLIVYCPDQLGPAVDRLLPRGLDEVTYPTLGAPQRIDWVDYAKRNANASPALIAQQLLQRTKGAIFLVKSDHYLTFGGQCSELDLDLEAARPDREVVQAQRTSIADSEL